MKKLLQFLANPFVLPILPTIILILILPFNYDRYLLEVDRTKKLTLNQFEWYDDLTLDGNSEKILMKDNGNYTWVAIYDHNENLYNQWNLLGNVDFWGRSALGISGDYDQCGQKEIFFITIKNDSILLHSIQGLESNSLAIHDRFITKVGPGKEKPDPQFVTGEMDDLNGDGKKELIFGLNSGFSLFPRNVFAYYVDQDSLISSPESFYQFTKLFQVDVNGDGNKEIIPGGMASSNVSPDKAKFHDQSNWMMVFDQNLQFLFEPVEIPGRLTFFSPIFPEMDGTIEMMGFHYLRGKNENANLYSFNLRGEITQIKDVGVHGSTSFLTFDRKGKPLIVLTSSLGKTFVNQYPSEKFVNFSNSYLPKIGQYDFEKDGTQEIIFFNANLSELTVSREGLKNLANAKVEYSSGNPLLLTFKESNNEAPQVSFQIGQNHYLLNYGPNPAYYLNFLYFLLIYTGMIGFAVATWKAQHRQFQRRLDTEKKITELQLSLVKNQLDPHFTMNAINAIIHSVNQNETEKANENLHRFSRLFRSLLLSADNPLRSLREELDFCSDYLELEKARFGDVFSFFIRVADGVDLGQLIPKMIIQTHAENAVKHGLSRKDSGGMLDIEIKPLPEGLEISISDNGVGRKQAAENKTVSTGKGLAIMKEFYNLYKKYYKKDISADIQDLFDEEGKPLGTRVTIKISRNEESH